MKHSSNFPDAPARTNWDEPLDYCNVVLPPLTRQGIHDHLLKMICCHRNMNVREAAESFANIDLWDMADELLELGEVSPTLRDAVLQLNLGRVTLGVQDLRKRLNDIGIDGDDLLIRACLLDRFLFVQDTAISTPHLRKVNGVTPLVRLAMECATLATSIVGYVNGVGDVEVSWIEPPLWLADENGKTDVVRLPKIMFEKIFMFYRSAFVRDSKSKLLALPAEHSPEDVARLSDLPQRDHVPYVRQNQKKKAPPRISRHIVERMKELANQGLFNAGHSIETISAELTE